MKLPIVLPASRRPARAPRGTNSRQATSRATDLIGELRGETRERPEEMRREPERRADVLATAPARSSRSRSAGTRPPRRRRRPTCWSVQAARFPCSSSRFSATSHSRLSRISGPPASRRWMFFARRGGSIRSKVATLSTDRPGPFSEEGAPSRELSRELDAIASCGTLLTSSHAVAPSQLTNEERSQNEFERHMSSS